LRNPYPEGSVAQRVKMHGHAQRTMLGRSDGAGLSGEELVRSLTRRRIIRDVIEHRGKIGDTNGGELGELRFEVTLRPNQGNIPSMGRTFAIQRRTISRERGIPANTRDAAVRAASVWSVTAMGKPATMRVRDGPPRAPLR